MTMPITSRPHHPPVSPTLAAQAPEPATQSRPLDLLTPEELAQKLQNHFKALAHPNTPDRFHLSDLKGMAEGKLPDGQPATQEQVELAQELLKRPKLLQQLDQNWNAQEDSFISWNDLAVMARDFESVSDKTLLAQIHKHFEEYGGGDDYVNFNELKEAAGERPSSKYFSSEARAVAKALLKRPELLEKLDIGVGFLGFPGKQDERFDTANIDHTIRNASDTPHRTD